jgi:hypothetical protein
MSLLGIYTDKIKHTHFHQDINNNKNMTAWSSHKKLLINTVSKKQ